MRVVVAVHDPPVWTIPLHEVRRIAAPRPAMTSWTRARRKSALRAFAGRRRPRRDADQRRRSRGRPARQVDPQHGGGRRRPDAARHRRGRRRRDQRARRAQRGRRGARDRAAAGGAPQAARRRGGPGARISGRRRRSPPRGPPVLSATRVLVIGLGSIGARIAAMAAGLGMQVTGMRRQPELPAPAGVTAVVGPDQLRDGAASGRRRRAGAAAHRDHARALRRAGVSTDEIVGGPREHRARPAD